MIDENYMLPKIIVAKIVVETVEEYTGIDRNILLERFTKTDLFEMLMDKESFLWTEGYMYIVDLILSSGMLGTRIMRFNKDIDDFKLVET
jgi:hypothetical protein